LPIAEGQILVTERGHPVRLSAKREQVVRIILPLKAELLRTLADRMSALRFACLGFVNARSGFGAEKSY
jgi:hypothetical protein